MAVIGDPTDYDAAAEVIRRRGLTGVYDELICILRSVPIKVLKKCQANGAADIREQIDAGFNAAGGWTKTQVGGVDWVKEISLQSGTNVAFAALGVEVQASAEASCFIVTSPICDKA